MRRVSWTSVSNGFSSDGLCSIPLKPLLNGFPAVSKGFSILNKPLLVLLPPDQTLDSPKIGRRKGDGTCKKFLNWMGMRRGSGFLQKGKFQYNGRLVHWLAHPPVPTNPNIGHSKLKIWSHLPETIERQNFAQRPSSHPATQSANRATKGREQW